MRVLDRDEILTRLESVDPTSWIEDAFCAYSDGRAIVPPPGELIFDNPPGDVHIKYGHVIGEPYFIVKVASGFYRNPELGLSSSQGLMLLMDARTGREVALLRDGGVLTDIRTAIAGGITARYLAPPGVDRIGVLGAGIQARLQAQQMSRVTGCRSLLVWNRSDANAKAYRRDMEALGFCVTLAGSVEEVCSGARLIVTTTPSKSALVEVGMIRPGTHVTAVGADTPDKRELDSRLLARADRIVVDSRLQSAQRGEVLNALIDGAIDPSRIEELGDVIRAGIRPRDPAAVSVAILTGLAVQDLAMANCVLGAE